MTATQPSPTENGRDLGRRSGALDRNPERPPRPKVAMVTMLGVVWVDQVTGERVDQ